MHYLSKLVLASSWFCLCAACGAQDSSDGSGGAGGRSGNAGGTTGTGGVTGSGGGLGSGGTPNSGGFVGSGGAGTGGQLGTGGVASGGAASGGTPNSGGFGGSGGAAAGGNNTGGASTGGTSTGGAGAGGASGGGAGGSGGGGGPVTLDCNAAMPTSGAAQHSGNGTGGQGNLVWEIWSNTGEGELTSYGAPAFTASWAEAGGYLGRLGFEWGGFQSNPKPYEQHGAITAQIVSKKSGNAGGYSYIGMYGWSTNPCVEWYVVEDSFNPMPINPGTTTLKDEVDIGDEGTYIMYTRPTSGSGGTRCSGVNDWIQYYSIRKTARQCGTVSLTKHFDAWKGLGMPLGNLLEAKVLVEVGGGTGKVDLPIANVIEAQ